MVRVQSPEVNTDQTIHTKHCPLIINAFEIFLSGQRIQFLCSRATRSRAQNPPGYPGRVLGLSLLSASFCIYYRFVKRDPLMADFRRMSGRVLDPGFLVHLAFFMFKRRMAREVSDRILTHQGLRKVLQL